MVACVLWKTRVVVPKAFLERDVKLKVCLFVICSQPFSTMIRSYHGEHGVHSDFLIELFNRVVF